MTPPTLKIIKPTSPAQRATHTTVDTIMVTPEQIKSWKSPPFQRPLRVNEKVRAISETMKVDGGVIPGILTIGVYQRERYLLDGQHRREAFLLTGLEEGYCDVRIHHFESMADMGEEFVNINSSIVKLRPDDVLRGLEQSMKPLAMIRERCPFVGYDMIRRSEKSPILSMSLLLRAWGGSAHDVPHGTGASAMDRAKALTMDEAEACCTFLGIVEKAWGRHHEYQRMWSALNLTLCMWLYRRTVLGQGWTPDKRSVKLNKELFTKCMMSLTANSEYVAWLFGRQLSDHDRSPCFARIKAIVAKRVEEETGSKPKLPQAAWASHQGGGR